VSCRAGRHSSFIPSGTFHLALFVGGRLYVLFGVFIALSGLPLLLDIGEKIRDVLSLGRRRASREIDPFVAAMLPTKISMERDAVLR